MFCIQCGVRLREGLKFCINCGAKLEEPQARKPQSHALAESMPRAGSTNEPALSEDVRPDTIFTPTLTSSRISPIFLWGGIIVLLAAVAITGFLIFMPSPRTAISDTEIEKVLQAKFAADSNLSKCTLEVHSQNGIVTLIGAIHTDADKSAATSIAVQQKGVRQVNVYGLVVNGSASAEPTGTGGTSESASGPAHTLGGTTSVANSDIRTVDFRNFDYSSSCCGEGNGDHTDRRPIHVSQGKWMTGTPNQDEMRFGIVNVAYGDVTGDGRDEAIVHTSCSGMANFDVQELYIFAMNAGGPTLLARLTPDDWGKGQEGNGSDYAISKIRLGGGYLDVSFYSAGSHACADWIVTARFLWNGSRFVRDGLTRARNHCQ